MEKLVVNKEFLKRYKSLLIVLENCDVYEIGVENILDVDCIATPNNKKKNEYYTNDGYIKISEKASQTIESCILRDGAIGTEWDHPLKERLKICGGCADMTSFALIDENNQEIVIRVPYNPLEDIMHGVEIELSNCSSLEIDNDGNMTIAFGESSNQPKRKDNNYSELVVGWQEAFGENQPTVLKVKLDSLSIFGKRKKNFLVSFKILDKFCNKKFARLVFVDCKAVEVETFFPQRGDCEIVMSKMANGQIYVGFDGLGLDFVCSSVLEYEYYCKQNKE